MTEEFITKCSENFGRFMMEICSHLMNSFQSEIQEASSERVELDIILTHMLLFVGQTFPGCKRNRVTIENKVKEGAKKCKDAIRKRFSRENVQSGKRKRNRKNDGETRDVHMNAQDEEKGEDDDEKSEKEDEEEHQGKEDDDRDVEMEEEDEEGAKVQNAEGARHQKLQPLQVMQILASNQPLLLAHPDGKQRIFTSRGSDYRSGFTTLQEVKTEWTIRLDTAQVR